MTGIGLNDRQLADDLFRQIDHRIASLLEDRQVKVRYGTVDQIDLAARKVAVNLAGQSSPGFSYGEHQPAQGDRVAVLITPDGARLVIRILGRDVDAGDTFAFWIGR